MFLDLLVGSWNVRSLVGSSGDARICKSRPINVASKGGIDHKLDMLVK